MNIQKLLAPALALLLAAGCAAKAPGSAGAASPREVPPALTVISGEGQITAATSTYSWDYPNPDGTRTGVEACGRHPLDMLDDLTPLDLHGPTLALRFDAGALRLESLTLRGWSLDRVGDPNSYDANFFTPAFTLQNSEATVTLPNDESALFEAHARWSGESQGDAYYAFFLRGKTPSPSLELDTVAFSAQVVRVAWRDDFSQEGPQVIRSAEELQAALGAESSWGTAFDGLTAAYDASFFAGKELLLIRAQAGSGSVRFWVDQVLREDAGVTVRIGSDMPEVGTSDMGAWLLLIEVPADTVLPGDTIHLAFMDPVPR